MTTLLLRTGLDTAGLQVVADTARELSGADAAWVVAGPDDVDLAVQVVSGLGATPAPRARSDPSFALARHVILSGAPVTVDDLAMDTGAPGGTGPRGSSRLGPAVVVPMRSPERVEGAVGLAWVAGAPAAPTLLDPSLPTMLAEQAALALHLARARRDQQELRLLQDRDRIARDLHDLVIQRLFAVGLALQGAGRLPDRDQVAERLDWAVDELDTTIQEIRGVIFALGTVGAASELRGTGRASR